MKLLGPSDKIHTIQDAKRIVNGSVVVTAKGVDGVCTEVNLPSHAWSLILTEPPCEFTFIQPTPRIVIESWPFAINELSFEKSKTEILFSPNPSKAQACMSAKNLREIYSLINSCKQFKKYLSKRSLIDELTSDANEWSISIASVFSVITRSKKRLENATSFPARLSALYGALPENSSKVSILPLSEHNDISIAGAEKNLAKIIELVSLSSGIDYRHFYIAGDCASLNIVDALIKSLELRDCAIEETNYVSSLLKGVSKMHQVPGGLHIGMHMCDAIFRAFYGGLIQPCQVALGWKRIRKDPLTNYQGSSDLTLLILHELQRLRMKAWAESLNKPDKKVLLKQEWSDAMNEDLYLDLQDLDLKNYSEDLLVLCLATDFLLFCQSLEVSNDPVTRFFASYISMAGK